MERLRNIRDRLMQRKGVKDRCEAEIHTLREKLRTLKMQALRVSQAHHILQDVAQQTQKGLEFHLSTMPSMALRAVFPDNPYELSVRFVTRRNQTEVKIVFERDGEEVFPGDESGVGPVDIASFALQIVLRSIQNPPSHPILFADEPFKNLSSGYMGAASSMLSMLSQQTGMQLVIITHKEELLEAGDRIFRVTMQDGVSHIVQEK